MKRNLLGLKLSLASAILAGTPFPFDTPSQPLLSQPTPKKELSKYDLEALEKARLKRERKAKDS